MKQMSTENESIKLRELFLAIYFNDVNKLAELKEQLPEIYAKRSCFQIDENTFDLRQLTLCNQIIWNSADWKEEVKSLVDINVHRTEKMIDFWKAENLNLEQIIQYNNYHAYFYCNNPNDNESREEILGEQISFFLEKGFREVDLRLYNSVECFDFKETKRLLNNGAKTDVHFYADDDSSVISRISAESAYLTTGFVVPNFKRFSEVGYAENFNIHELFGELIGLAAHEEMWRLIHS